MSSDPKNTEIAARLARLERMMEDLQKLLHGLQSDMSRFSKDLEALSHDARSSNRRYVATCPSCNTAFDMLAHHYSIGLFDNLVYVKCPSCHKALPLTGDAEGGVKTVKD
jgi:hypothetical protein